MKKVLALLLALVLVLSLASCGDSESSTKTIKDVDMLTYENGELEWIYVSFNNDTEVLKIEYSEYDYNAASSTGKLKSGSHESLYTYTLKGDNKIITNGGSYEYTIYPNSHKIKFDKPFLGYAREWGCILK